MGGWRAPPTGAPRVRRKDIEIAHEARSIDPRVRESSPHHGHPDAIEQAGVPEVEIFCARQHLDYRNKAQVAELATGSAIPDCDCTRSFAHVTDDIWAARDRTR